MGRSLAAIERDIRAVEKEPDGEWLEPGVRDIVLALRRHGYHTTGPCEGHLDRWHPWPWVVMFNLPYPRSERGKARHDLRWHMEMSRLQDYLILFNYTNRRPKLFRLKLRHNPNETPGSAMLSCSHRFLLSLLGCRWMRQSLRERILARSRQEMREFAEFLNQKPAA